MRRFLAGLLVATATAGCGISETPVTDSAVGVAAGAGTGAIIGAVISNGDVATSALLGGAIGLPVGLVLGGVYEYYSDRGVRERKMDEIQAAQAEIYARQREIDSIREQIHNEGPTGLPDESLHEYQFNGHTLGNYYR